MQVTMPPDRGTDDRFARWAARPIQAMLLRIGVFLLPIAGSIVFVHFASRVVAVPVGSFVLFISWWIAMTAAATIVLIAIDGVSRRLLPLVALYKLSLVFPDAAPSRFKVALRSNTVETLEEQVAQARSKGVNSTPGEAAERLLTLVSELNQHDRLTRGHSDRVRAYVQMIGKEMRLPAHDLDLLNWAALLHDVGKLRVPTEILTKPGEPDDAEWAVLRRHPEFGEELVAPLRGWLGNWADAVGQHHEKWDGTGYPRRLGGEEIAVAGRIVAVADVFDVITSARSYKESFSSMVARNEIARGAGTQFDPAVVRAFLNVSLGRLRLVMGPLSWLAHAPILGRLPLTPAIGTLSGSLATVAAAVTTGLASPAAPVLATTFPPPRASLSQIDRVTNEDQSVFVGLGRARRGRLPSSVRVTSSPDVGRVAVMSGRSLGYTPPPGYHGIARIGYEACWSRHDCAEGVVVITVRPVNDPPVARADVAATRRGTPVSIDVLSNDSDPDGDALTIVRVSAVSAGRASIAGGRVVWTPPPRFAGLATFRYTVSDDNGGRALARVRVNVSRSVPPPPPPPAVRTPVSTGGSQPPGPPPPMPATSTESAPANHPPVARDDVVSVPEGGRLSLAVLANDVEPDGDRLTLSSVKTPARGRATSVGDRVQFVAPTNYVGRVRFSYTIADPQGATSSAFVDVDVLLVNVPPSFSAGADQAVLEDAGPNTVDGWASWISAGSSSEFGQTIVFDVSTTDSSLFASGGEPTVAPNGTLSFRAAPDTNGKANVTIRAKDNGGTANGGVDTSATRTFSITIIPVNDAPSFTAGQDQSSQEDSAPQSVPRWASGISSGPANESGQSVSFVVSTGNPALFTGGGQPAVSSSGTLTYTAATNANGTAAVTVRAKDNGGTTNGGVDASAAQTFTITVSPVNDAPMFKAGVDQTIPEDAGARSVGGWASGISPGPPNESDQSVSFVVSTSNSALFTAGGQPTVAPDGTLTFTSAPNANGSATVTARAKDTGGSADGGSDLGALQTFAITVTPVNDPPVAVGDSATVSEDDSAGVTFDVLDNDTDVDAGDVLSVSSFDGSTITNGTLTASGGSFTYVPETGFVGSESFDYTASDGNGGSATATVTITVTAVQHAPVAGNDVYATQQDTPLNISAPGVLANDGDQDGNTLTVQTTPVSGASNGTVSLAVDGSFTYTPNAGFTGSDSFTYRVDDGTGRSADGVVSINVSAAAPTSSTLYLQRSGPSADVWNMSPSHPPPAAQRSDRDSGGKPGLTIKNSDGEETITEGAKYQTWIYTTPSPMLLAGPVTLDLWSSFGVFGTVKAGIIYSYLYDCTAGGLSCTRIASNTVFANPWNTSLIDWSYRSISIGNANRTIPTGNELRVRVQFQRGDLWVTTTAAYSSALVVTLG